MLLTYKIGDFLRLFTNRIIYLGESFQAGRF